MPDYWTLVQYGVGAHHRALSTANLTRRCRANRVHRIRLCFFRYLLLNLLISMREVSPIRCGSERCFAIYYRQGEIKRRAQVGIALGP
jgi:hypothetical protein